MDELNVQELRSGERYSVTPPLRGSFGASEIHIANVSDSGAQVKHMEPLKLGSDARLAFAVPQGGTVSLRGRVVWSHMSHMPTNGGRYTSGIRIENQAEVLNETIKALIDQGLASPDSGSIERKREVLRQKYKERAARAAVKQIVTPGVSNDEMLMIQGARDRLRANPDEARKWYLRAKFALNVEDSGKLVDAPTVYRDEVLAVWEYLERSIDLATVINAFAQHQKRDQKGGGVPPA